VLAAFSVSVEILLSEEQYARAMAEAQRRQTVNEAKRLRGRNNAPSKGDASLEMHRLGCTGEAAVAAHLGLEEHLFEQKTAIAGSVDLPGRLEVKTRSKHGYDLLIQLDDDPTKLFVLVTCNRTTDQYKAMIIGWTYGANAMRPELVREFVRGRPCYAIPQSMLQPIETLDSEVRRPTTPSRILAPSEAWLSQEDEEMMLNIGDALALELGWQPGDTLLWTIDESNNSCYLKKVNDSKA